MWSNEHVQVTIEKTTAIVVSATPQVLTLSAETNESTFQFIALIHVRRSLSVYRANLQLPINRVDLAQFDKNN